MNINEITPPSFILDFKDEQCDSQLVKFYDFYIENHPNKAEVKKKLIDLRKRLNYLMPRSTPSDRRNNESFFLKPILLPVCTSESSPYLWFIKPPDLNRGRGIKIFSSLEQFEDSLVEFLEGYEIKPFVSKASETEAKVENEKPKEKEPKYITKHSNFVIQKYIEKPLLIHQRKFDIRVWVLLTHNLEVYFFKFSLKFILGKDTSEHLHQNMKLVKTIWTIHSFISLIMQFRKIMKLMANSKMETRFPFKTSMNI